MDNQKETQVIKQGDLAGLTYTVETDRTQNRMILIFDFSKAFQHEEPDAKGWTTMHHKAEKLIDALRRNSKLEVELAGEESLLPSPDEPIGEVIVKPKAGGSLYDVKKALEHPTRQMGEGGTSTAAGQILTQYRQRPR